MDSNFVCFVFLSKGITEMFQLEAICYCKVKYEINKCHFSKFYIPKNGMQIKIHNISSKFTIAIKNWPTISFKITDFYHISCKKTAALEIK